MFSGIPKSRLLTYIVIVSLLPLIFVLFFFQSEKHSLNLLNQAIEEVGTQGAVQESKQTSNVAVIQHYKDADRFYLDKNVENLMLMKPEIETLQNVIANKNFLEDEAVRRRYDFLTKGNSIVFAEGAIQRYPLYSEVIETLVHPVEVDTDDTKAILSAIEGVNIGPYSPGSGIPQFLVLDFRLEKKKAMESNDVFLLNLKLLRRDYLP